MIGGGPQHGCRSLQFSLMLTHPAAGLRRDAFVSVTTRMPLLHVLNAGACNRLLRRKDKGALYSAPATSINTIVFENKACRGRGEKGKLQGRTHKRTKEANV